MPGLLQPLWARLEASPLGYRLAHGFFWSLVGTVLSRSLSLLSSILVARMLGKVGMGELGIIQSTVGIFSAFAGLGLGLTATKFVSEFRQKDPARAGAIIGLSGRVSWISGALMTASMMALAPWFAERTLAAPHLSPLIRIGSLLLFFGAVNGAQTGALSGFEAFKTIARVNLWAGLLNFPLMVGGAWWYGLKGAVWGLVAGLVMNWILNHFALRREAKRAGVPMSGRLRPGDWRILWGFSLPGMLCNLVFGPVNWAASALLVNRPDGYAEMGVFNAANNWFNAVAFLPGVLAQVVLPMLAAHAGDEAQKSQRKVVSVAIKANVLATLPAAFVLALASPFVMACYGTDFRAGWPVLIVAVFTAVVVAVQGTAAQSIVVAGRMWPYLAMYVGWGLAFLGGAMALVRYGALGLAIARLGAYVVGSAAVFWFAIRFCWREQTNPGTTLKVSSVSE